MTSKTEDAHDREQIQVSLQRVGSNLVSSSHPKSSEEQIQWSEETEALIEACRKDALYSEG